MKNNLQKIKTGEFFNELLWKLVYLIKVQVITALKVLNTGYKKFLFILILTQERYTAVNPQYFSVTVSERQQYTRTVLHQSRRFTFRAQALVLRCMADVRNMN